MDRTDQITIPAREADVLRDLLRRAFDEDATPDQRTDVRLRVLGRLLLLLDGPAR